MFTRRIALAALIGMAAFAPVAAMAAKTFDANSFAEAQKAGVPILVDVSAPWCPTCQVQKSVLDELYKQPEFKNLVVFEVDFDSRKDVLSKLGVRSQSTLIVYKGTVEKGRTVGDTNRASIAALLAKTN